MGHWTLPIGCQEWTQWTLSKNHPNQFRITLLCDEIIWKVNEWKIGLNRQHCVWLFLREGEGGKRPGDFSLLRSNTVCWRCSPFLMPAIKMWCSEFKANAALTLQEFLWQCLRVERGVVFSAVVDQWTVLKCKFNLSFWIWIFRRQIVMWAANSLFFLCISAQKMCSAPLK